MLSEKGTCDPSESPRGSILENFWKDVHQVVRGCFAGKAYILNIGTSKATETFNGEKMRKKYSVFKQPRN